MHLVHAHLYFPQNSGIPDLMGINGVGKKWNGSPADLISMFDELVRYFLVKMVVIFEDVVEEAFHMNKFNLKQTG